MIKPTFKDRMNDIQSTFEIAHESASNLHSEIEEVIKAKELQIKKLQSEIYDMNITKKEIEVFLDNIDKLV